MSNSRRGHQTGLNFSRAPARDTTSASPSKRARVDIIGNDLPTLPPNPAPFTPPLKPTTSYFFRGKQPLYTRYIIEGDYKKMEIRCGVPGYLSLLYKAIDRALSGTNNLKTHYRIEHPEIPTSKVD